MAVTRFVGPSAEELRNQHVSDLEQTGVSLLQRYFTFEVNGRVEVWESFDGQLDCIVADGDLVELGHTSEVASHREELLQRLTAGRPIGTFAFTKEGLVIGSAQGDVF